MADNYVGTVPGGFTLSFDLFGGEGIVIFSDGTFVTLDGILDYGNGDANLIHLSPSVADSMLNSIMAEAPVDFSDPDERDMLSMFDVAAPEIVFVQSSRGFLELTNDGNLWSEWL